MRPMPDPLCCVVLSMLEREPLRAYDVVHRLESRGLIEEGAGFQFALATLERPSGASLIRHRPLRAPSARFALTHRGRCELHLQRILWLRAAGLVPPSARLTRGPDRCEAARAVIASSALAIRRTAVLGSARCRSSAASGSSPYTVHAPAAISSSPLTRGMCRRNDASLSAIPSTNVAATVISARTLAIPAVNPAVPSSRSPRGARRRGRPRSGTPAARKTVPQSRTQRQS